MSGERPDELLGNGASDSGREAERRWLELFGESGDNARRERERLEAGAFGARLRELDGFLDTTARTLRELDRDAAGLTERVLASTTGAEQQRVSRSGHGVAAGPWGDLVLVGRWVSEGVRSSGLLRLAAASLLVHVLALPVLAYIVLRARATEEPRITFELGRELPAVLDDRLPEPDLVEGDASEFIEPEAPRDRERRLLRERRPPRAQTATPASGFVGWLDARAELVRTQRLGDLPPQAGGGLERALRAELLLDAYLLLGAAPAGLSAALAELGDEPIERMARDRARSYGLAAGTGRAPELLGPSWRDALRRAIEVRGPVPEHLRAWLR